MKILHIVDYLMPTMGYQEFILPKFNAIDKNNEVYILTGNAYYPVPNYDNTWRNVLGQRKFEPRNEIIDNVNIIREKIVFEISNRPWISNLKKNIEKISPDIIMVHGTSSFSAFRSAIIAKRLNLPLIMDNHMIFSIVRNDIFGKLYYFIVRTLVSNFVYKNVKIIFGVTKETCDYLIKCEGHKKEKVKLLNLGVDSTQFYPEKNITRNKDVFKIIQTGKLNKDKRPDLLALAVIKLLKKNKKFYLTYYGDGDPKIINYIKQLFKENDLLDHINFEPFVSYKNLRKVFNNADLCVFPFGTSLSAVECAFCGTNVIMTNDDASIEREKDGVGICYKTGNIDDLVEKIEILSNRIHVYKNNLILNLNKIKQKYDYQVISKVHNEICEKLVNENKKKF